MRGLETELHVLNEATAQTMHKGEALSHSARFLNDGEDWQEQYFLQVVLGVVGEVERRDGFEEVGLEQVEVGVELLEPESLQAMGGQLLQILGLAVTPVFGGVYERVGLQFLHFLLDVLSHVPIDHVVPEKVRDFPALLAFPIDELVVGVNVSLDVANGV